MDEKRVAVLHHNDADGFGAAYAAWLNYSDNAHYIKVQYGKPVPEIPEGVTTIFIVDFSYATEILDELATKYTVVVIDHHKTAEETLKNRPGCVFDLNKSGCVLTFEYFFGTAIEAPTILRYVQDRDLWKFKLPHSDEINAHIYTLPEEFEVWDRFDLGDALYAGQAIISYRNMIIEQAVKSAVLIEIDGHSMPIVNATTLISEIGKEMCKYFNTPASISYCDRLKDNIRTYSLRSVGDFDVSAIAKRRGGGGHKNAAGFSAPLCEPLGGK